MRQLWGAVAAALVLTAGAGARADNAVDALKLLDQGIALFNANNLPAARELFVRARDLVPDKANPYRWLGMVDARMGKCTEAVMELELFLQRVPVGDPRSVEAITIRDRCKDELQPKLGTVVVETTPPGAEVRLDEMDAPVLGVTPYRNEGVPAGPHVVFVRLVGFTPVTKGFRLQKNETVRLDLSLAPQVAVATTPAPVVVAAAPPPAPEKKRSRVGLIVGVTVGVVAAVALGVGLGVGLGAGRGGGPAVTQFPPVVGP
jgi:hypothetical protein